MWRGQICTEAWCPNILYVLSQKCSCLRCVFYFEGRERKYGAWLRAGRCVTVRVHHVAAVYGWGVPECVEGAGRAAAGGRMGAVRGDDGSENLPALWQGRKSPVKLLLLLQEKRLGEPVWMNVVSAAEPELSLFYVSTFSLSKRWAVIKLSISLV